jgi:tRNA(adenine34) deaminase
METNLMEEHAFWMQKAIRQAENAYEKDEVPIGAVIVCKDKIIGKGQNQTELLTDATAHAEILAISAASQYLGAKYLEECTMYVTVEPCVMCMGAIKNSRLKKLIIGAKEPKTGFSNFVSPEFYTKIEIEFGEQEAICTELMREFFKSKR